MNHHYRLFPLLVFLAACFPSASPNVKTMKCNSDNNCPVNYWCEGARNNWQGICCEKGKTTCKQLSEAGTLDGQSSDGSGGNADVLIIPDALSDAPFIGDTPTKTDADLIWTGGGIADGSLGSGGSTTDGAILSGGAPATGGGISTGGVVQIGGVLSTGGVVGSGGVLSTGGALINPDSGVVDANTPMDAIDAPPATVCPSGTRDCGGGLCVNAVTGCCAPTDCAGSCRTCQANVCSTVVNADDTDSCTGTCDGSGVCKSKKGQACQSTPGGCIAGTLCADSYCCNRVCSGSCEACDIPASIGTCTVLAPGSTPHPEHLACAGSGVCAGSCTGNTDGSCGYPTVSCAISSCSLNSFQAAGACNAGTCLIPPPQTCTNVCSTSQGCTGECVPTRTRCEPISGIPQICNSAGAWSNQTACKTGAVCVAGICNCASPKSECPNACVDLTQDPANCGACGRACVGVACVGGICQYPTYSVTYNSNGALTGTVPEDSKKYQEGETVTVLGNTGVLARRGYVFAGWNTKTDGKGTNYAAGSGTFQMGAINSTIYAKWIIQDASGNTYTEVTIGSQVWLVENLKTLKYSDGTTITPFTVAFCGTNNNSGGRVWAGDALRGAYYDGSAVITSKLAINGWRIPARNDWLALIATVQNNAKALAATLYWSSSTSTGAVGNDQSSNNSTGFYGIPAGMYQMTSQVTATDAFWWTSNFVTEEGYYHGNYFFLNYDNPTVEEDTRAACNYGLSVRLLRDY